MHRHLVPLRRVIRDAAARLLHTAGVTRLGRGCDERLTIVTFHRVLPPEQLRDYPIRSIAVTPRELAWFVDQLRPTFTVTTLRDAGDRWSRRVEGKPPLAITFDDGQLDNFLHARPVLERAGVRGTFFATSAAAESGDLLWHDRMGYSVPRLIRSTDAAARSMLLRVLPPGSRSGAEEDPYALAARAVEGAKRWSSSERVAWIARAEELLGSVSPPWDGMMKAEELRELAASGHEIGCHARSHEILPQLDDGTLRREIVEAGARIAELSGQACTSFCYPNGDHDSRCLELVREHYDWGVTVAWGSNRRGGDPAALRRFDLVAENNKSVIGRLSAPLLAWRMSSVRVGSQS